MVAACTIASIILTVPIVLLEVAVVEWWTTKRKMFTDNAKWKDLQWYTKIYVVCSTINYILLIKSWFDLVIAVYSRIYFNLDLHYVYLNYQSGLPITEIGYGILNTLSWVATMLLLAEAHSIAHSEFSHKEEK